MVNSEHNDVPWSKWGRVCVTSHIFLSCISVLGNWGWKWQHCNQASPKSSWKVCTKYCIQICLTAEYILGIYWAYSDNQMSAWEAEICMSFGHLHVATLLPPLQETSLNHSFSLHLNRETIIFLLDCMPFFDIGFHILTCLEAANQFQIWT